MTRTLKLGALKEVAKPLAALRRSRPRAFVEWEALARWGQLAPGEERVAGYRLRQAREQAGLTQSELARRLGITQQAVARAERWAANPTIRFVESWARALGKELAFDFQQAKRRPER